MSEPAVHRCFFKIGVLKNFSILARKYLCWILNKTAPVKACTLIKKEIPTQVFSCEYCIAKFLRTVYCGTISVHCTFLKFYVMIELFGHLWVQNDVFLISCTIALFSFKNLVLESKVHGYFMLFFITEFLVSVNFTRLTKPALVSFWLNR